MRLVDRSRWRKVKWAITVASAVAGVTVGTNALAFPQDSSLPQVEKTGAMSEALASPLCCSTPILLSRDVSGVGKVTLDDGRVYQGELDKGEFEGEGTLVYPDGTRYVGVFQRGLYHGQGTLTMPNGGEYQGEFSRGQYHGQGTLTHPGGESYSGTFLNGQYHGKGELKTANGTHYEGAFLDGKYNGQGTLTYDDGTKYIGRFLNGEFSGVGVFILKDGSRLVATWQNGKRLGYGKPETSPAPEASDADERAIGDIPAEPQVSPAGEPGEDSTIEGQPEAFDADPDLEIDPTEDRIEIPVEAAPSSETLSQQTQSQ